MYLLLWLVLLGMLSWLFADLLEQQRNPNREASGQIHLDGSRELALRVNRSGHYLLTGRINGVEIEMLLDTGASDISIPAGLADSLSLKPGIRTPYQTANGTIHAHRTRIARLELGTIVLQDVAASLNPAMGSDEAVLLGMSALRHLELVQRDGRLLLRQP